MFLGETGQNNSLSCFYINKRIKIIIKKSKFCKGVFGDFSKEK